MMIDGANQPEATRGDLNGLASRDKTVGLETRCVGGGQGMAMIIEWRN